MTRLDEAVRAGIPARAAAGAEWLDLWRPGWAEEIDLEDLDMGHPFRCVLGQLYGVDTGSPLPHRRLPELGFWTLAPGRDESAREWAEQEYELLDQEWQRLILARRGGAS